MSKADNRLRETVANAMPRPSDEPPFERVWQAAQRRAHARSYGLHLAAAASVAAIAVAVIVNVSQPPSDAVDYIEASQLFGSTSWTAPSDVLLPEYSIDIYRDVPSLPTSTKTNEGALL